MNSPSQSDIMPVIVTLEMAGVVEAWGVLPDGGIGILLLEPLRCESCKTQHVWFVNRNGSTRCVDCDFFGSEASRKINGEAQ
jgi:hypothetical protein